MESSRTGWMILVGGRRTFKVVSVNRRSASRNLGFQPLPSGKGDETVPGEVDRRAHGLSVGLRRIHSQKILRAITEALLCGLLETLHGWRLRKIDRQGTGLVAVPPCQ